MGALRFSIGLWLVPPSSWGHHFSGASVRWSLIASRTYDATFDLLNVDRYWTASVGRRVLHDELGLLGN